MTTSLRHKAIRDETDLFNLWSTLIGSGGFACRTLWLIFLDADGRTSDLIVPIDDLPDDPEPEIIENLAGVIAAVRDEQGVHSVPMLLSRPGPAGMTDQDRRWAAALTSGFALQPPQWPIHLATCDRLAVFAPDDLVA